MSQKSWDLDPIPSSVLYDCLDEIIPIVTSIMNKSLSSGIVPQCFKHALVKPLLKKSSLEPNCLKHYRPVSNLPFLSKVLERTVLKQFLQRLQSHSRLEPFQSANRKFHSTETALLRVITRLHSTFSCSGTVLDWFISYLSCRTQSVFVGHESTPSILKCGVLQGSVLGPLLFTLYSYLLTYLLIH